MALIDKLASAERLIVAGIGMLERGEDALAIHVVAASAMNMLRELYETKRGDYQARVFQEAFFIAGAAQAAGQPIALGDHRLIEEAVTWVSEQIAAGKMTDSSQLEITLSDADAKALLAYIYKPYNFLKHGDRDPLSTLDETDIEPEGVIQHALLLFSWLDKDRLFPESIRPFAERHGIIKVPD